MGDKKSAQSVSLDDLLNDFEVGEEVGRDGGTTVSIWVTPEVKERYNRMQKISRRKFSKKVRELFLAALEVAEKKAS